MITLNRTRFLAVLFIFSVKAWPGWGMQAEVHPIFQAIDVGNIKEIKRISVSQMNPWQDEFNELGQTALYRAVLKGEPEIVSILLKNSANPNNKNSISARTKSSKSKRKKNETPLRYLVEKTEVRECDREIFDLLLQYGAPFEAERKTLVSTIKRNLSLTQITKVPREEIQEFSRLLFRYVITHINSLEFERSKTVWHIFARGTTFAALVKEALMKDESSSRYSDMIEILSTPEPWIFSRTFPSAGEMKSIFDDLEAVLEPLHFLRFAFVMQQSFYEWVQEDESSPEKEKAPTDARLALDRVPQVLNKYHRKPTLLADDLFNLDRDNFLAVSPQQFVQHVLRVRSVEGFHHQVKFSNGLKNLVLFSILYDIKRTRDSGKSRDREKSVKAHKTWLAVGERLFHLGDLFGAQTIFAALECSCFQRLKIGVGKRDRYKSTIEYLENNERFAKYRKYKETCLENQRPLIPLCSAEASDLAINGEVPAQIIKHGVKMFNTEKIGDLWLFVHEWSEIQRTLSETSEKVEREHDQLREIVMMIPDEYPNFLSYCITPRPTFARTHERKILPLWTVDDFEDFYCHVLGTLSESPESKENYEKFCTVIEHAIFRGLSNGLALFYEFLSLEGRQTVENEITLSKELFTAIEAYLTTGIMTGIAAFERAEEKDLYHICSAPQYSHHMAQEDYQSEKDAAARRWIIYFVKNQLDQFIIPLKEKGIYDCESFMGVFGGFVDEPANDERNKRLHKELNALLEQYGVHQLGKRLKLRSLLYLLADKSTHE